jgi:hypothetical protein
MSSDLAVCRPATRVAQPGTKRTPASGKIVEGGYRWWDGVSPRRRAWSGPGPGCGKRRRRDNRCLSASAPRRRQHQSPTGLAAGGDNPMSVPSRERRGWPAALYTVEHQSCSCAHVECASAGPRRAAPSRTPRQPHACRRCEAVCEQAMHADLMLPLTLTGPGAVRTAELFFRSSVAEAPRRVSSVPSAVYGNVCS